MDSTKPSSSSASPVASAVKSFAASSGAPSAPANISPGPPLASAASTRIVFFCKDCEKIVDGVKVGRKYVYKCPVCGTKNVAFGTERSIRNFYHVEESVAVK